MVTRDSNILEVARKYPVVGMVFRKYGIGCIGCMVAAGETLGEGIIFNNSTAVTDPGAQNSDGSLVSGSADNLRWEVSNISNSQGTFSLSIRQGDDNTKSKTILETFNNLSLDPNSSNYIESVIGNQTSTVVTGVDGTYIRTSGEYINRSKYARISAVNLKTLDYLANDGTSVNTDTPIAYITTIGLYSSNNELLAVAKLSEPLRKDPTNELTLRVRLDY